MPYKALLFDLNGTIRDIRSIHLANWLEVLRPHGIEVDMDLYSQTMHDCTSEEVVDELLPNLSDEEKEKLLDTEEKRYRSRVAEAGPITGLHKLLEEAHARDFKLALVSNAQRELACRSLESLGLIDTFDLMVFAGEVGVKKPDSALYETALKRLGLSPDEALAFEDSSKGVEGAVRAGIPVVGLASTHPPEELREAGVELVVGDFADRALLERLGEGQRGSSNHGG